MARDLGRVEARDEPECEEPAVVGLELCQCALQIDEPDGVCRIVRLAGLQRVGDIDDGTSSLGTDDLARLVGGDGDQPGPHLVRIAQGVQPAPGDRPCGLNGVTGRLRIAADDECNAGHRRAVLGDEAREGCLVTLGGETDGGSHNRCVVHGDVRHAR